MARKEKKYHYIYKTTNLKNGKFYVGMHSTDNLNDGYLGSGTRLRRSIRKNGPENFKLEILEFLPNRSSLKARERELVNDDLLKESLCMNLQPGGGGGICNETHKVNLHIGSSKYQKQKWQDDEYRNKIKKILYSNMKKAHKSGNVRYDTFVGKSHSDETKKKIGKANSIKQKGEGNSQFGTCWITNGTENKKIKKTEKLPKGWEFGRKY
jgi:group I intron endonuclease